MREPRGDQDTAAPSGPRVAKAMPGSLLWALAEASGAAQLAIWGDELLVSNQERFSALFGVPPEVMVIRSAAKLVQWLSEESNRTSTALVSDSPMITACQWSLRRRAREC